MRESSKTALGGIVAALAVIIMLVTYLSPLLVYTAPPFAGLLLILIINEIGYSWSVGTYAAISLLSVFIIADKEAAVLFTFFFGYYPILRDFLENKIHNKIIKNIIKIAVYNISLFLSVTVSMYVFNVDYSEFGEAGKVFTVIFWILMNVVLVFYDVLLSKIQLLYEKRLKAVFRRLFKR